MGVLSNSRWEKFAQELAKGKSATEAYELLGISQMTVMPLGWQGMAGFQARVAEILSRVAAKTEFTIEKIAEMLSRIGSLPSSRGRLGGCFSLGGPRQAARALGRSA